MQKMRTIAVLILLVMLTAAVTGQEARLLRQPHINGNTVVFVYAGDLYTVPVSGGDATRLTSFEGFEVFPRFSPDGKWIAFSGEYGGTRQIYVIPAEGGVPKRCTWYPDVGVMPPRGGWDNLPYDWTPDSKKILVRSNKTEFGERIGKYFLVDPFHESLPVALPPHEGGPACFSPEADALAYSIKSREFRTWKRYKAGFAQDIWIYDLKNNTIDRITDYPGTDNFPMWIDNTIYFNSDRTDVNSSDPRTLNIYAFDRASRRIRKVTRFTDFDVMRPSKGVGGIVFENGGYLYYLDPVNDTYRKITVRIHSDKPNLRPVYKDVTGAIESSDISPSARRVLFAARGDLFTVPAEHGDIRNITRTPAVREFSVDWSPDGKYISYLSEETGDYELYIREYNSDAKPRQITKHSGSWITGYVWSHDGRMILVGDKKNRLRLVYIETGREITLETGYYSAISGFCWSPDDRWVAYSMDDENGLSSIWVFSLERNKSWRLTDSNTSDYSPVFSADGKTLSFISARDFNWSRRDFDTRLYIGTLTGGQESPFAPLQDDEGGEAEESGAGNGKKNEKKGVEPVSIDPEGFGGRVVAYPLPTGRYGGLTPVQEGLVYLKDGNLCLFDMKERKEKEIMSRVRNFTVTPDEKKFLYESGRDYGIASLRPGQKAGEGKLDLSQMKMRIDPAVEFRQIYTDAWRIMRDWFYDPGMHGVDWKAMHDKYLPLVEHVAHRTDLDYIIGELISELNCGHTYVNSGDVEHVQRVEVGLLGCEFRPDGGFYRISRIYAGENWDPQLRSPLTEAGIDVKPGEYLIGIDGDVITTDVSPYRFLENKAEKLVTLLINDKPSREGAREVTVKTITSEIGLRHYNWVERNRALVDSLSGGRIGYIYVPNTSQPGFKAFYRGWLSQHTRDGLIIDDRYNGGGSLPHPMALDMFMPKLQYWARRNMPLYTTPFPVHEGPKVMLINGRSSSGGDAFPDYFQELKLGPLMGQKTWGGLVGYSGSPRLVDGGGMAVPQFAYVNNRGQWDVEYYGVDPDIEAFDDPVMIYNGRQPMLEKAVDYILSELKKHPPKKIEKPKGPDRH
ncbi:PDZ domain-containing protein [bacterium]|nr:PDZ domain-containing protein [bacterium]